MRRVFYQIDMSWVLIQDLFRVIDNDSCFLKLRGRYKMVIGVLKFHSGL